MFEFFSLAFKRLISRRLLSVLLILNTALSIGITVGIPVFSGAVSRRILQQEINTRAQIRGWPMFSVRINAAPTEQQPIGLGEAAETRLWLASELKDALRLPISSVSVELQSPIYRLAPRAGDETYTTEYLAGVQAVYVENVAEHIQVYQGQPFGEIDDAEQLHVWVEKSFADKLVLEVGEQYDLGDLFSSGGDVIPIKVAGFWQASEPADHFWPERPQGHFDGNFLVTGEQFESFILRGGETRAERASWYYVFEDRRVQLDRADQYIAGLQRVSRDVERRLPDGRIDLDPSEDLARGQRRKTSLSVVLFGFSIPLLVILGYSLSSLSETESRLQEQEISMLASRGSTRWQLLLVSGLESLLIILAAIPIGVGFALLLAHLLGYATGFLSFTLGDPLAVSLLAASWTPMIAILMISLLVRLAATSRVSRQTIISYEQSASRPPLFLSLARLFMISLLVLVTVYAYRQLGQRGAVLASLDALDPRNDPLVLLAPTLFIFTAPLVAAELFVLLVHPIDLIGRFLPWVSAYLASMNLVRASAKYRATVYRLTLSLTLGVFYASVAKSADIWLIHSIQHQYGADLIVKLTAEQGDRFGTFGSSGQTAAEVPMLSSDIYDGVEGVGAATRVGEFEATIQPATGVPYYRLLAVERLSFPNVVYFRSDYARESLGELMNRLALEPRGVLLPSNTPALIGPEIGDMFSLSVNLQNDIRLRFDAKVVGFFDDFPTMYPEGNPLVIANLDYLEMNAGILPHDIWLKLEPDAGAEDVLVGINQLRVPLRQVKDLDLALQTESGRLERTGIFGLLSFCFIAGAMLSVADVLVYTTSMLRERALRHAVLQALGVERRTVLITVVYEQAISLVYGLAVGIAGGVMCAQLYGPFLPLGSGRNPPIPPFIPYVDWSRTWWIALFTGGALVMAQFIVLARLTRTHLFEALRMGDRP